MNEKFILSLFDKFEKGSSVLLHVKEGETELTLKKEAAYQQNSQPVNMPVLPPEPAVTSVPAASENIQKEEQTGSACIEDNLVTVKSPIVGSFYRSPSPDAPAYVEKGAKVSKGQPLCILEAMKMMNTLECEYDGVVEDILAANGDLVEFDQPLFIIRI